VDTQVNLGAYQRVGCDLYAGEQTVAPIALHGVGNLLSGHLNLLADRQPGEVGKDIVFIALDTLDSYTANLAVTGCTGVRDIGIDNLVLRRGY
jgi:hypothetical protein